MIWIQNFLPSPFHYNYTNINKVCAAFEIRGVGIFYCIFEGRRDIMLHIYQMSTRLLSKSQHSEFSRYWLSLRNIVYRRKCKFCHFQFRQKWPQLWNFKYNNLYPVYFYIVFFFILEMFKVQLFEKCFNPLDFLDLLLFLHLNLLKMFWSLLFL